MDQGPLKLYVNKAFIAPDMSFTTLLYPFWGLGGNKKHIIYLTDILDKHGFDKNWLELVDTPEEAEYFLVPHEYWRLKRRRPDLLQKITEEARAYHKPLLVDASGDEQGVVEVPNAKVLRINQYRFELPAYEVKIPVACEDLLETYYNGVLQVRQKDAVPTIGFVGWGTLGTTQRIRSLIKELPLRVSALFNHEYAAKFKGVFWRERAINIFKKSSVVKSNFIIRSSYSGSTTTIEGGRTKNRQEFVSNIANNDYTLVVRGDANEATRFYETLSLGRIPVLIDTAVVLPLEHLIHYREFCLIIDHRNVAQAPEIVAKFHASVSNEQFVEMQKKARHAFEQYLRLDSFTRYMLELLRVPMI